MEKLYQALLFILFIFSCSFEIKAQDITLDSNYVKTIISKAESQVDSSAIFENMESALLIARSINYLEGKAKIVSWLANYYNNKGEHISSLRYYLELLEAQKKGNNNLAIAKTKFKIGEIYERENLTAKAIQYYSKIDPQALNKTEIWQHMARCYLQENLPDSANHYIDKIYKTAKEQDNYELMLTALQEQVNSLNKEETYQLALKHNLEILEIVSQQNNKSLLARAYNNLGYNYHQLKDYPTAIDYFIKAIAFTNKNDQYDRSVLYTNLGILTQNTGDLNQSIKYLLKGRQLLDRKKMPERFSYLSHLISTIYYKNKDVYNALIYNEEAIAVSKKNNDKIGLKDTYDMAATIHQGLHDYEKAMIFYKQHLSLRDSFLLEDRLRQQSLLQQQYLMERAEKEIKILISNQEIQDLNMNQLNLEKDKLELSASALRLEAEIKEDELTLLKQEQDIREASIRNKELKAKQTEQALLLTSQQLKAAQQEREISDLNRTEAEQRLALAQKEGEEKERLKEIDLLSKDKELLTRQQEIAQLEIDKQSAFRQLATGLGALAAVILGLIFAGLLFARRSNKKLSLKNKEIENQKSEIEKNRDVIQNEKAKSEELLLNILPIETARELRDVGSATPMKYELVSVLFSDFSGFTSISKTMTAEELIQELNECFIAFDEIIDKYGLEKIKTIGDAYMCAGGLPTPNKTNPRDIVNAAIEMTKFMNKRIAEKLKFKQEYWKMRIGIHSGEVIAGVVGKRKFAYDIWGDTVNIASRMESNGAEGKINISAATYEYVKDDFEFTCRGSLPIKNGGEVEMYFVDSKS